MGLSVTSLIVISPFRISTDTQPICRDLLTCFEDTQDERGDPREGTQEEPAGKHTKGDF